MIDYEELAKVIFTICVTHGVSWEEATGDFFDALDLPIAERPEFYRRIKDQLDMIRVELPFIS